MSDELMYCLICDEMLTIEARYPVYQAFTPHSGILLKELLRKVSYFLFNECNDNSFVCKNCFSLLEQFDLTELSFKQIKQQICEQLIKKYGDVYSNNPQFAEVACQTEEYLLNVNDNIIKGEIKVETVDDSDVNSLENKQINKKKVTKVADLKTFECKQCTFLCGTKTGLANHVARKHKNIDNIEKSDDLQSIAIKLEKTETVENNDINEPNLDITDDNQIDCSGGDLFDNDSIDIKSNDADYEPPQTYKNTRPKRKRGRPPANLNRIDESIAGDSDDADNKPLSERKFNIKSEKTFWDNSDSECNIINNSSGGSSSGTNNRKKRPGRPKKNSSDGDEINVKPYIYQCPQCPKKWRTKSELRIHLVSHSDVRAHVCDICGQAYKKRTALDIHIGMHAGINPYTCNICGKVFTQKGALNRHLPIHTGEANYQCDLCGKRFIHHTSFSMHALTHSGLKAYKCEICGLGLMSTSHLKRHMRAHSGEKKYACSQCGKRFAERYNLAAHERLHFSPGEKRKRSHSCPLCGDTFQRRQKLEEHLASNHQKISENDESRKWAGSILNNAANSIAEIANSVIAQGGQAAAAAWSTVFPGGVVFPPATIKTSPDRNESTDVNST